MKGTGEFKWKTGNNSGLRRANGLNISARDVPGHSHMKLMCIP